MPARLIRDRFISLIKKALHDYRSSENLDHAGLRGRVREIFAESLLHPILLPGSDIGTGKITDSHGNLSAETDLVIYSHNTLPPYLYAYTTGVFPVESCIYSIEVKSKLTATELRTSIDKMAQLKQLRYLYSYYPWNISAPFGPACSSVIPALFAFTSDLSKDGKTEIDRYRELDPGTDSSPIINTICIIGRGYWRFEIKQDHKSWIFYPPTSEYDEVLDFISGIANTIPREIWKKGRPEYGNYISKNRPTQKC